jgi:hypothetical protein
MPISNDRSNKTQKLKHRRWPILRLAFAGEFPALEQARAHNVPANAKQARGFKLIAVTIFVRGAHHVSFDCLIDIGATLLEEIDQGALNLKNSQKS